MEGVEKSVGMNLEFYRVKGCNNEETIAGSKLDLIMTTQK